MNDRTLSLSLHRFKAAYLSGGGLNLFWETNELFSMGRGCFQGLP